MFVFFLFILVRSRCLLENIYFHGNEQENITWWLWVVWMGYQRILRQRYCRQAISIFFPSNFLLLITTMPIEGECFQRPTDTTTKMRPFCFAVINRTQWKPYLGSVFFIWPGCNLWITYRKYSDITPHKKKRTENVWHCITLPPFGWSSYCSLGTHLLTTFVPQNKMCSFYAKHLCTLTHTHTLAYETHFHAYKIVKFGLEMRFVWSECHDRWE